MFHDILDYLNTVFAEWSAALILVAVIGACGLFYLAYRMSGRIRGLQRDQDALEAKLREEHQKNGTLQKRIENLEAAKVERDVEQRTFLAKVRRAGRHFVAKWRDSERRRLAADEQIRELMCQEGKFWERPPGECV